MNTSQPSRTQSETIQQRFEHLIKRLEHVLPAQAPIADFVHHNTLQGYQSIRFEEALNVSYELTGAYGYLSSKQFRSLLAKGRISEDDLNAVIHHSKLTSDSVSFDLNNRITTQRDILRTSMMHPIDAISASQYTWKVVEEKALERMQGDVSKVARMLFLQHARQEGHYDEKQAVSALWLACLDSLQIDNTPLHPETFFDLSPESATKCFAEQLDFDAPNVSALVKNKAQSLLKTLCDQVGERLTLSRFLSMVLGVNILDDIYPVLLPHLSEWLDQGVSAWRQSDQRGFYVNWKAFIQSHRSLLHELDDWTEYLDSLPDDPLETIMAELQRMGIDEKDWEGYLEQVALELPGWSGMFLWYHRNPNYQDIERPVNMLDYFAVRLVLEHIYARQVCRKTWLLEANISDIRGHFRRHEFEFLVRYYTYNSTLPEYLLNLSQSMISTSQQGVNEDKDWRHLAHLIATWQATTLNSLAHTYHAYNEGWRLFLLAQYLGWSSGAVRQLDKEKITILFATLALLEDKQQSGFLWLQAYERHYRDKLFSGLIQNHQRGKWEKRGEQNSDRPDAQVIFCMDDREEGFRRHLEEINVNIETLGAAAFFNLPINWQGLDDNKDVKLCPVPITPVHLVKEVASKNTKLDQIKHKKYRSLRVAIYNALHQTTRHSVFKGGMLSLLAAPAALGVMLGKSFMPYHFGRWVNRQKKQWDHKVNTTVELTASKEEPKRSATNNQQGFTDQEQATLVASFLQTNGLIKGFGHFVVMMGHYSTNQNNPHQAAYGCGACSGRYSGPNARIFSRMANRPEIRQKIADEYHLIIPDDCWFIGVEHDTGSEALRWTDTDLIPSALLDSFKALEVNLMQACERSAHERCRKLASAPKHPNLKQALKHIIGRTMDYSQARPELGHATNASAIIGRRSLSRGMFLDRRTFLISYDYTLDPDGDILERTLLSVGPVGAGINLEYYFSCVNNHYYGSGSKVTHNLVGLFGVMAGASSDLRTGLPKQMIEIHEPMRLQIILEAKVDTVVKIYKRQSALQELIGNGWVLVSVKDPDTNEIFQFDPITGFHQWKGKVDSIPTVEYSADWYKDHYDHLSHALITASVPDAVSVMPEGVLTDD